MLRDARDDPSVEIDLPFMDQHSALEDGEEEEVRMEEILVGEETIEVPSDLYTDQSIFHQFFSVDTWNDLLPEEVKMGLLKLLPSFQQNDIDEKAKTIEMLFSGENFFFGNPINKFRRELLEGDFSLERRAMKSIVREAQERDHKEWLDRHKVTLVQELLDSRKVLLEEVTGTQVTSPRIDTRLIGSGGLVRNRIRKRYLDEMTRIKKEVGEIGLSSDDEDDEEEKIDVLQDQLFKRESSAADYTNDDELSHTKGFTQGPVLTQDLQPCFLALLREIFLASPGRSLSMNQLHHGVTTWQASPIAALNPWYQDCPDPGGWQATVEPAVSFLSGAASDLPRGFLPMLRSGPAGGYEWVAQGRDTDSLLLSLSSWWLEQLSSNRRTLDAPNSILAPETQWTVRPSSLEERQEFQRQERARYSQPAQHFRWTHPAGYTSLVGPVKGLGAGRHAKQHAMLVPDRPAGVTILTLVRDAVSRLPNGEGTRTDIIELLKDSQFLVSDLDSGSLTTTVSGALDRLQNEPDASVRFDSNKKIWVYLHRDRTAEDFMTSSRVKTEPSKPRKKKMKVTNGQAGSLSSDSRDEMGNRPPASILETALAGAGLGIPGAGLMSSPSLAASSKSGQSPSMGITSVLAAKPITAPPRKASTSQILEPTTLSQPRLTQNISATSSQLGGTSVLEGTGVSSRTFPPAPTLATPPLNILESPKASG